MPGRLCGLRCDGDALALREALDQISDLLRSVLGAQRSPDLARTLRYFRTQQDVEPGGQTPRIELLERKRRSYSELLDAVTPERLIAEERADEGRQPRA